MDSGEIEKTSKRSILDIPSDCQGIIFKNPNVDLQAIYLLAQTCKYFNDCFNNILLNTDQVCENDRLWISNLIQNNHTQSTKMLIFYADRMSQAEIERQNQDHNTLCCSYDNYHTTECMRNLFSLTQQRARYDKIFTALYQHAKTNQELILDIVGAHCDLTPAEIYSGKMCTADLKSKAFLTFLRAEEFDLMLQVVRKNIGFFRNYYFKDTSGCVHRNYHMLHYVYVKGGLDLVKKVVACGIDIKTPLEILHGSDYYTLLYAGYAKNDQKTIDLLLREGDKYKKGMKNPLNLLEIGGIATGQLKEINMERVKLLLSQYYTQESKNELLKDALEFTHFDTRNWVGILLTYGADLKSLPLWLLCRYGDLDVIKSLFAQKSIEVCQYNRQEQCFIITYSIGSGNLALLDFICSQGFHPDTTHHRTALYYAVMAKQWESAKILLKHGANINNFFIIEEICLQSERYEEQVRFLVDNGIDIDNIIGRIDRLINNNPKNNYWKNVLAYFMDHKTPKETDFGNVSTKLVVQDVHDSSDGSMNKLVSVAQSEEKKLCLCQKSDDISQKPIDSNHTLPTREVASPISPVVSPQESQLSGETNYFYVFSRSVSAVFALIAFGYAFYCAHSIGFPSISTTE